ncbi:DUF2267 domain-containing protein [Dactylosporangium matsuzakiense]|uniref:DUF2267 domain-containing protein n=1 Tax=Dactylosporangium matsuzakiense TaxID=53360 RepID=A0A9W6NQR4_9ACTN|nr:DUF2267 domain-containing protein [Dactylosporangium matsuzakiense]UWZ47684.1 DUF2267 domain-containing protein [Dactylosporangium matsuzakiense]GLL05638.1 hypothetical protein GCM10017581_073850 [Dactylosporangium matsuzakiense]
MEYDTFIGLVRDQGGVEPGRIDTVSRVAVSVLAQGISADAAAGLADQLPDRFRPYLRHDGPAESYGADEYLRRLGRHIGASPTAAEYAAHAVLMALREAAAGDAYRQLRAELPTDFGPLFEPAGEPRRAELPREGTDPRGTATAPPEAAARERTDTAADATEAPAGGPPDFIGVVSADEFVDQVAERTRLDRGAARLVTETVLETLAMRVSAGQIDDLKPFVPPELHPAFDRGTQRSRGRPRRIALEQFLDEIAVAEGPGVTEEQAAAHARAVLTVLRDIVPEKEYRDTVAQLPKEYSAILPG